MGPASRVTFEPHVVIMYANPAQVMRLTTGARLGDYHRLSIERLVQRGPGRRVMAGTVEY